MDACMEDGLVSRTRKQRYPGHDSRNFDPSCRSHGGCPWCRNGRKHKHLRAAKPWRASESAADGQADGQRSSNPPDAGSNPAGCAKED